MATKKKTGGQHKTKRTAVQFPIQWMTIAKQLAAKRQQPMMWYILGIIGEEAAKAGLNAPKYPWED